MIGSRRPGGSLNADNNPGKARWCDDPNHMRLECTGQRKRGQGPCHSPAIRGTDKCKIHGGKSRAAAIAQGKAQLTAWTAIGAPGGPSIDASAAVIGMLNQSWFRAAMYSELLRRQVVLQGDTAGDIREDEQDASGLIGFTYGAAGRDGTLYAQAEAVRALVVLESAERDRVVKYAETAHKMGISSRVTEMAERWGDLVITRLMLVLDSLGLSPEQEARVPALIQAHLGQIEVSAGGDGS